MAKCPLRQAAIRRWEKTSVIVEPQTVIGRHRAGFHLYWHWRPRCRDGRPPIVRELIQLICQIWQVNPTWGNSRIHDELARVMHSQNNEPARGVLHNRIT